MRGEPDRDAELPCRVDREVVLADVHVVGTDQRREIRAVVDHERHAEPRVVTCRASCSTGHELRVGQLLVAELDEVDAAADGCREELGQVGPGAR